MPVVAGVTSIGFDHIEYLGDTLEAIAREKAGIFKPGVPAVDRRAATRTSRALLAAHARERGRVAGARRRRDATAVATSTSTRDGHVVRRSTWRGERATAADAARRRAPGVELARRARDARRRRCAVVGHARRGGARLLPACGSGPLSPRGPLSSSTSRTTRTARACSPQTLPAVGAPRPVAALLTRAARTRTGAAMLGALAPVVDLFVLTTAPTAPASRAWNLAEALDVRAVARLATRCSSPTSTRRSRRAERLAATVLVTGSFHTVGDAMARLQVDPLAG